MTTSCCGSKCLAKEKDIQWVRCTQFAGDHPFCDICAKKEKNFLKDDDSCYWVPMKQYKANKTEIFTKDKSNVK
jgi:hypothetical protein